MYRSQFNHFGQFRVLSLALITTVGLILAACGSKPASTGIASGWTGKVDGTDAYIALVTNGTELMAYVCDSQTVAEWFHGKVGEDKLDLVAGTANLTNGHATLVATLTQAAATGTVTLADGQTHSFTAGKSTGDGGLYRLEETQNGDKLVSGWVVLNDGELRGGEINFNANTFQPLTTLNTLAKIIPPTIPMY